MRCRAADAGPRPRSNRPQMNSTAATARDEQTPTDPAQQGGLGLDRIGDMQGEVDFSEAFFCFPSRRRT